MDALAEEILKDRVWVEAAEDGIVDARAVVDEAEEDMKLDEDGDADKISLAVLVALPEVEVVSVLWPVTLNS